MKNIPWTKIGITLLWVLGIATIGISLAFTEIKQQDLKCKKITINVNKSDENYFINKQDISAIIQFVLAINHHNIILFSDNCLSAVIKHIHNETNIAGTANSRLSTGISAIQKKSFRSHNG